MVFGHREEGCGLCRVHRTGRTPRLALRRLHKRRYVPPDVIVDLSVPDRPHQHVVRAGDGPGRPGLGQLDQRLAHVVRGQVSQRDVPDQHRDRPEQVHM